MADLARQVPIAMLFASVHESALNLMKRWCWPFLAVVLLSLLAAFRQSSGAGPDLTPEQPFMSRAEVRQQGAVTVRAAVLTDDESERYFGASLADQGIQAVWLSVENAGDLLLRFLPIVTDPNYFSAPEVERLLRSWWPGSAKCVNCSGSGASSATECNSQKRSAAGFVFTHREGGLKLLEVGFETERQMLRFKFVLPVGGSSYAIEKVDFGSIYRPSAIEAVNLAMLREKLAQLQCCTTDKTGKSNGDPLNIVIVGTASTRYLHSSGGAGGLTSRSTSTVFIGPHAPFCLAANILTHRLALCTFLGASRTSRCRRRAIPSACAIIYGFGWHRSRLMDSGCGLDKSAATSALS